MSELTDELEYIMDWLKSTNLEFVDCYNPGLNRQQIDTLTEDFPFRLPDEIYELYQWRNGKAELGDNNGYPPVEFFFLRQYNNDFKLDFLPLKYAMEEYKSLLRATIDDFWHENWFPIASFEGKVVLYVVSDMNPSPVFTWDNILGTQPRVYKDLTSMISVIAECCEFDVYQIIPDEYGYNEDDFIIQINEEKFELEQSIFQKYNS